MLTAQLCDAKYCIAKAEQLFVPPNNEVIFYQAVQSRNTEPASWEIIVYLSPICRAIYLEQTVEFYCLFQI